MPNRTLNFRLQGSFVVSPSRCLLAIATLPFFSSSPSSYVGLG